MASSRGRRLVDGMLVNEGDGRAWRYAVVGLLMLLLFLTCPSHQSFVEHLTRLSHHPSRVLSSLASAIHATLWAKSTSYGLWRVGTLRERTYIGVLGMWVSLGNAWLDKTSWTRPRSFLSGSVCGSEYSPYEILVMVSLVMHFLWRMYPRLMDRHAVCSLRAVQQGRVWVLVSSAVSHASFFHLIHNCMHLLQAGPITQAALGCEDLLMLIMGAALASSFASIVWHGMLGNRPSTGSLGASGIVMALVAANVTLFPHTNVLVYGLDMAAPNAVLFYMVLDVVAQSDGARVDASAHIGGALWGLFYAQRWRRLRLGILDGIL